MGSTESIRVIESIIQKVLNNNSLQISADQKLMSDLGLESIDLLDVGSELENVTGKEVDFKKIVEAISQQTGQNADMKLIRVKDLVEHVYQ